MNVTSRLVGLLFAAATLTACTDSGNLWGGRNHGPGSPPVANAGSDQTVPRGADVWLNGSGSYAPGGGPLAYRWVQLSGPPVTLAGELGPYAGFTAPAVAAPLRFRLTVTDGAGASSADEVTVTVAPNQPPFVYGLTISPTAPITTDDLVATGVYFDPDFGDSVTLAWEWRRNGVLLPGAMSRTLPASLTSRGDVIALTLRVTDGALEASTEATVTIQDAPPVVAISSAPVATWGEPYTFTATAIDPDGDPPGSCVLRRGPAGMTLSPSCTGAWTPTLPMFDRELEVSFEVGLVGSSLSEERTIQVVDATRQYPLYRTGLEIPAGQRGLIAIDPDGDGTSTLLSASGSGLYELAFDGGTYRQVWTHPLAAGVAPLTAVNAGDVDDDGRPEIFLAAAEWYGSGGVLLKLDGAERREVARATIGCLDLELADLDRDGAVELLCLVGSGSSGSTQRLVALDPATLAVTWQSGDLSLGASLAVGNVDADAALEIVTSGGYVVDGLTRAVEWSYSGGFGAVVDTGDLDGDGVQEIVGMDAWDRFRGFSAAFRSPLWEHRTFDNDALLVADVDRDGVAEIVVGDGQWGDVTVYRYRPATNDVASVVAVNSLEHGVTSFAVADLDGDGQLELAWGSGATSSGPDVFAIAGMSPGLTVEWTAASPRDLDGPFLGAVAARTVPGAALALLFQAPAGNSGYDARLARLDPSGAVSVSVAIGTNWGSNGALAAADFDGDGVDEAAFSTASPYDGNLVAWDFAAGAAEWTSPATAGNVRALQAADLNGDGAPDLVTITFEGYVHVWDVRASARLFSSTGLGSGVDVAVADLDGDNEPELVALSTGRLTTFRKATSGPVAWLEAAVAIVSDAADLAISDCDGDGTPEVYVLTGWYSGGMTVQRYDRSLALQGAFAVRGMAQSLFVEELGFARKNLVLGKSSAGWYSTVPAALEAVDPVSGGLIWQSQPLWGTTPPNSLRYVDLNGDGLREIAFGTESGMYLTR